MKCRVRLLKMFLSLFVICSPFSGTICYAQYTPPLPPSKPSGTPVFNKNSPPNFQKIEYSKEITHKELFELYCSVDDVDGKVTEVEAVFTYDNRKMKMTFNSSLGQWELSRSFNAPGKYEFFLVAKDDGAGMSTSSQYFVTVVAAMPSDKQTVAHSVTSNSLIVDYMPEDRNTDFFHLTVYEKDEEHHVFFDQRLKISLHQNLHVEVEGLNPKTIYHVDIVFENDFKKTSYSHLKQITTSRATPEFRVELIAPQQEYDEFRVWGEVLQVEVEGSNLERDISVKLDNHMRCSLDNISWSDIGEMVTVVKQDAGVQTTLYFQCKHEICGFFKHKIEFKYDEAFDPTIIQFEREVVAPFSKTEFEVDKIKKTNRGTYQVHWTNRGTDFSDYDGVYLIVSTKDDVSFDPSVLNKNGIYYAVDLSSSTRDYEILPPFHSRKMFVSILPYKRIEEEVVSIRRGYKMSNKIYEGYLCSIPEISLSVFPAKQSGGMKGLWLECFNTHSYSLDRDKIKVLLFDESGNLYRECSNIDFTPRDENEHTLLRDLHSVDYGLSSCLVAVYYENYLVDYLRFGEAQWKNNAVMGDLKPMEWDDAVQKFTVSNSDPYFIFEKKILDGSFVKRCRLGHLGTAGLCFENSENSYLVWNGTDPNHFNSVKNWGHDIKEYHNLEISSQFKSVTLDEKLHCNSLTLHKETKLYGLDKIDPSCFFSRELVIESNQWYYFTPSLSCQDIGSFEPNFGEVYIKRFSDGEWVDVDPKCSLKENEGYIIFSNQDDLHISSSSTLNKMDFRLQYDMVPSLQKTKWQLIGNPCAYHTQIPSDLNDFTTGYVYRFDASKPGYNIYSSHGSVLVDDNKSEDIGPNEAFFVEQVGAGSIHWSSDISLKHNTPRKKRSTIPENMLELRISSVDGTASDNVLFVFQKGCNQRYALKEDATKLIYHKKGVPQVYSMVGAKQLVIDKRPLESQEIELNIMPKSLSQVKLDIKCRGDLINHAKICIEDLGNGEVRDLANNTSYSIPVQQTGNSMNFKLYVDFEKPDVEQSFRVKITESGTIIESLSATTKQIKIFNVLGIEVASFFLSGEVEKHITLKQGVYMLKVVEKGEYSTTKIIVY
ncbi:T9SS type A sorting domain-containing protein [Halosquirtibacter laminarini]|uniref:T9SS type A sorting domain-containing protein n=1 Tax=Halosquirtibacter laminarini TaxID=3374600 RepID=A0AC61NB81_9BACT|nr:T9SS type A sorting domain-containing protein [Prolixibacteraceae bacterium]